MERTNGNGLDPRANSVNAATKLRQMLEKGDEEIIVAPGVYDGFSARIALEVGFDVIYMVCSNLAIAAASPQFDIGYRRWLMNCRLAPALVRPSLASQTLDLPPSTICASTRR